MALAYRGPVGGLARTDSGNFSTEFDGMLERLEPPRRSPNPT